MMDAYSHQAGPAALGLGSHAPLPHSFLATLAGSHGRNTWTGDQVCPSLGAFSPDLRSAGVVRSLTPWDHAELCSPRWDAACQQSLRIYLSLFSEIQTSWPTNRLMLPGASSGRPCLLFMHKQPLQPLFCRVSKALSTKVSEPLSALLRFQNTRLPELSEGGAYMDYIPFLQRCSAARSTGLWKWRLGMVEANS